MPIGGLKHHCQLLQTVFSCAFKFCGFKIISIVKCIVIGNHTIRDSFSKTISRVKYFWALSLSSQLSNNHCSQIMAITLVTFFHGVMNTFQIWIDFNCFVLNSSYKLIWLSNMFRGLPTLKTLDFLTPTKSFLRAGISVYLSWLQSFYWRVFKFWFCDFAKKEY